jgi:hypothetical protein
MCVSVGFIAYIIAYTVLDRRTVNDGCYFSSLYRYRYAPKYIFLVIYCNLSCYYLLRQSVFWKMIICWRGEEGRILLKKYLSIQILFLYVLKLNSLKKKIVDTLVAHPKATTLGTSLAVGAGVVVAADFAQIGIQMVHAGIGSCNGCATSFTPHALSSGLSGTGAHGVAKIFAPGQEALASGSTASSFSPGHLKP